MSLQQNDSNNDSKHINQQNNEHVKQEISVNNHDQSTISQQQEQQQASSSAAPQNAAQQPDYPASSLFSYADNPIARRFSHLNRSLVSKKNATKIILKKKFKNRYKLARY